MSQAPAGEPWFLVSLGNFGTKVAERLEQDRKYRYGWQAPFLSLRVEEGEEHRRTSGSDVVSERRREWIDTLRLSPADRDACFRFNRPPGTSGDGAARMEHALRQAFLDAYHAGRYLGRRADGDNRAVTASVAVVLDFTDPFARSALGGVLDVLPWIAKDLLAPLFQVPYRNLEVLVIGTAPVAEKGAAARHGAHRALAEIEARIEKFKATPEARPDLRAFILDDRSDRYVLREGDRVEAIGLFLGAVIGAGEPDSDDFREIRTPSAERGRHEASDAAVFGTFSVASLSYPGGLVERYCFLRQQLDTLQALSATIDDPAERSEVETSGEGWLVEQSRNFEAIVAAQTKWGVDEGIRIRDAEFAFVGKTPFLCEVGYTTPHHHLSDPNHRELGWLHEPGFEVGPDGLRQMTYWGTEQASVDRLPRDGTPTLDRLSVGVQVVQSERASEEAAPRPTPVEVEKELAPRVHRRSRWVGRVTGYTDTVLTETVPQFIENFDAAAPAAAQASRAALRSRVDELLGEGRRGLARAGVWLDQVQSAVERRLEKEAREDLRRTLPERVRPPGDPENVEKDWKGKFWEVVAPYGAWRRDLELRELLRRSLPYSLVALALWLLLAIPAAPAIDPRFADPVKAIGVALAAGVVAIFAPLLWDLYASTRKLRGGIGDIQDRFKDLVSWLDQEIYGKRKKLEEQLWRVRWLQLLADEVKNERVQVREVEDLLAASIQEVQADLKAMNVRFKKRRDGASEVDDQQDNFLVDGLFDRWYLPGGPPGAIYGRRRVAPEVLADAFLKEDRPFVRWRDQKPYRSLEPIALRVEEQLARTPSPNPYLGIMTGETRAAIHSFLMQFANATRNPLQVRVLPDASEIGPGGPGERRKESLLEWFVFAAAPSPAVKAVLEIADDAGLDIEPAGQMPVDRVMVVRAVVNVPRGRIENVLPLGDAPGQAPLPSSEGT